MFSRDRTRARRTRRREKTWREMNLESLPVEVETLEQRLMLAADGVSIDPAMLGLDMGIVPIDGPTFEASAAESFDGSERNGSVAAANDETADAGKLAAVAVRDVVFIDPAIEDADWLARSVASGDGSVMVHTLDASRDGISQISEILTQYRDVQSIHILSHGDQGELHLGSTVLNDAALQAYQSELAQWNQSLRKDADILLYGCNVADGQWGVDFVQDFAMLTGADVAASDDVTGNADLGGDWELEYTTGWIDASATSVFSRSSLEAFQYTLGVTQTGSTITIDGTNADDNFMIDFDDDDLSVSINGNDEGDFAGIDTIVLNGLDGNDRLLIDDEPVTVAGDPVVWNIDGGSGTLEIVSDDDLALSGSIRTSGGRLDIIAQSVEILTDSTVSTRDEDADGNSIGNSGALIVVAPVIRIGDGASLLASANGGFTAGNVILQSESLADFDIFSVLPLFNFPDADAEITIGAATITGRNVEITTSADSSRTADLDLDPNAAQRIIDEVFGKLSNPETTTLTFDDTNVELSHSETTTLTFGGSGAQLSSPAATTIQFEGNVLRRDIGSWVFDGFAAGMTVEVSGSGFNDGVFEVQSVSDDGTELIFGGDVEFSSRQRSNVLVREPGLARLNDPGDTVLIFAEANQRNDDGTLADGRVMNVIDREGGSWLDDGFAAGQQIEIRGSQDNDGIYTIQSISAIGLSMTLAAGTVLRPELGNNIQVGRLDSVVRDAGSWIDDGFTAGMGISIAGAPENSGFFVIADVTHDELLLSQFGVVNTGTATNVTVTDTDSITRSVGDWTQDRFAAGERISVTGSLNNDGLYTILTIDGDRITLREAETLRDESRSNVQVLETLSRVGDAGADAELSEFETTVVTFESGSSALLAPTITTLTFSATSGTPASIGRNLGSWLDEGFAIGDFIVVSGSGLNDGVHRITSVTATTLELESDTIQSTVIAGSTIQELDTITRSTGDWVADGFTDGLPIVVFGSAANDGFYEVAQIVDNTLILTSSGSVGDSASDGVQIEAVVPTVTFEGNGLGQIPANDIIRRSHGSWIADGFVKGQSVLVENGGSNDGEYTVVKVTDDELHLFESGFLFDETVTPAYLFGDVDITFTSRTDGDTMTRSSGNWLDDGFQEGRFITVTGSADNDGVYLIEAVDGDTLTLSTKNEFTNETSSSNRVIQRGDVTEILSTLPAGLVPLVARDRDGNIIEQTEMFADDAVDFLLQAATKLEILDNIIGVVQGTVADASSEIIIGNGASITATQDVTIRATSNSNVSIKSPYLKLPIIGGAIGDVGLPFAVGFASSTADATASLNGDVVIDAGGVFNLQTEVTNDMSLTMQTYSGSLSGAKIGTGIVGKAGGKLPKIGGVLSGKAGSLDKSLPVKNPAPTLTLAYGRARSDAESTVSSGTSITAGDAFVDAVAINNFNTSSSSSILFPEKNFGSGLSASVADYGSGAVAEFNGELLADSLTVNASSLNTTNTNSASVAIKEKVVASGLLSKFGDKGKEFVDKTNGGLQDDNTFGFNSKDNDASKFGLAAGIAFTISTSDATATIGGAANITTTGDVTVRADVEDNFRTSASGGQNAAAQVSIGGALNVAIYNNSAEASVQDNVIIVAGGSVTVIADADVPNQISLDDEFLAILNAIGDFVYDPPDFDPTIDFETPDFDGPEFNDPFDETDDQVITPPSLDVGNTSSTLASVRGEVQEQFEYGSLTLGGLAGALAPLPAGIVGDLLNFGVPGKTFTSQTSASSNGKTKKNQTDGKLAFGGTINVQIAENRAEAWVGEGASITSGDSVMVEATATIQTINVAGMSSLLMFFADKTVAGPSSDGVAIGASFNGLFYENIAKAWVADGVVIDAQHDVSVYAAADVLALSFSQAGGEGGAIGLGGTFSVQTVETTAIAHIEETARVTAGGDLSVAADTDLRAVDFSYTNVGGGAVAVGVTVSLNIYDTTTQAFIGNDTDSEHFSAPGTFTAGFDMNVEATNRELLISASLAGSKAEGIEDADDQSLSDFLIDKDVVDNRSTGEKVKEAINDVGRKVPQIPGAVAQKGSDLKTAAGDKITGLKTSGRKFLNKIPKIKNYVKDVPSSPDDRNERTFGVGISADVAINIAADDTQAWIGDGLTVTAGRDINVIADNSSMLFGTTLAIAVGGEQKGGAGAGSAAFNILQRTTKAWIGDNVQLRAANVNVIADSDDFHISLTAGGAGAKGDPIKTQGGNQSSSVSFGVAGSADVQYIENDTEAYIGNDAIIVTTGSVLIEAENKVQIGSVAGAVGISGQAGIGAAVDVVIIVNAADAWIGQNTNVQTGGNVVLSADNQEDIGSIGASLGIGTKKLGVGGSASLQIIDTSAHAAIRDDVTVLSNGSIWVDANDDTRLLSIAGGGGFADTAGFGAALAGTFVIKDVSASVGERAIVTALGRGDALDDPAGDSSAVHGLTVEATVTDGYLNYAGSAAASKEISVAASWVPIIVIADVSATIGSDALINVADGPTDASINSGIASEADDSQSVRLNADHFVRLSQAAGSLGAGVEGVGVGASLGSTILVKDVTARIDSNATVRVRDDVSVRADSTDRLLTVSGGVGGGEEFGGAGTATVIVTVNTTDAKIDDGAIVHAFGDVAVIAVSDSQMISLTGELAVGQETGAGASLILLVSIDLTDARIGEGARVSAFGQGDRFDIPVASRTSPAAGPDTKPISGVAVTAVSLDDVVSISIGANIGLDSGLTGSIAAIVSVDSTTAEIEAGASINESFIPNATSDSRDVEVRAAAKRNMLTVGGAMAGGTKVGMGVSVASNLLVQFVSASVNDAVVRAHDVKVTATADNLAITGAFGAAVTASTNPGADDLANMSYSDILALGDVTSTTFSGTGSVAGNVIFSEVDAVVDSSTVVSSGTVDLLAAEDTVFAAGAGGVAITATNTVGSASGGAIGASLAGNVIASLTAAKVVNSTVTAVDNIKINAISTPLIVTVAIAGAVDGSGSEGGGTIGTGAGAFSVNSITNSVVASITDSTVESTAGDVSVTAEAGSIGDAPNIIAAAGAVSVAGIGGTDASTAVDIGAAVSLNNITSLVDASIESSEVKANENVIVAAETNSDIVSAAAGLGITAVGGIAGGNSFTAVGSAVFNLIISDVDASIDDSTVSAGGAVVVDADDHMLIASAGGGASAAGTTGTAEGTAVAVLATAVISVVVSNNDARVKNSTVSSVNDIAVTADADGKLFGTAIAGAGAGTGGLGGGTAVAVGGAIVINELTRTINAQILDNSIITTTAGDLDVSVTDSAILGAAAGTLTIAASTGGAGGNAVAAGASIAIGNINSIIDASITDSTVTDAGNVRLIAESDLEISTLAIGFEGSGTGGGGEGTAVAAGASVVANVIVNEVDATVRNSDVTARQDVSLTADNNSVVLSGAGEVGIAVGVAAGGGAAVSVGASIVANEITNLVDASIVDSTVSAASGNASVTATADATIFGAAISGQGAGTGGVVGGNVISVVGSAVLSVIVTTVDADITNATVEANDVNVTATNTSQVFAAAGTVQISASAGASGNALGFGAAVTVSVITSTVHAAIEDSTVTASGNVALDATYDRPDGVPVLAGVDYELPDVGTNLFSVALGLAGGGTGGAEASAVSGVGSGVSNTIVNSVEASINQSTVLAGGSVSLNAENDSTIGAGAGGAEVSAVAGGGSAAVSVGASIVANVVVADVHATISDSNVTAGTDLTLTADTDAEVYGAALNGAGAVNASGAGNAIVAAGGGVANTIVQSTEASIRNTEAFDENADATIRAINGDIRLSAEDSSRAIAAVGAGTVAVVVGAEGNAFALTPALTFNTIASQTTAAIARVKAEAGGDIVLNAVADAELQSAAFGVAGGGSGGEGAISVAAAGSGSGNLMTDQEVSARITSSDVTAAGNVRLTATNDIVMGAGAGGAAISISAGGGGAQGAAGAAFGLNVIDRSTTESLIVDSDVTAAGHVSLSASSSMDLFAATLAAAAGGVGGAAVGVGIDIAAAGSSNSVVQTVAAEILGNSNVDAGGNVSLSATEDSLIVAAAGEGTVAIGVGGTAAVAGALGAAISINTVDNTVRATIGRAQFDDQNNPVAVTTLVEANGDVTLTAESSGEIVAAAIGFAGGGSGGGGVAVSVSAVGSLGLNFVDNKVEAAIIAGETASTQVTAGGDIKLSASDSRIIGAGAGGISIGVGIGGTVGVSVGVAASVTASEVTSDVLSHITNATVTAGSDVDLSASSEATIRSLAMAGSLGVGGGGAVGVGIAAAGAATSNTVDNSTQAVIREASVKAESGNISLTAIDESEIISGTGQLAIAVGIGIEGGGVAAGFGAALAHNVIENEVVASIDNSMITAGGDVSLVAESGAEIITVSSGLGASVGGGFFFGVGISSVGSVAINEIDNSTEASIQSGSIVESGGSVSVTAIDSATIRAGAGGVAFSVGGGAVGVGVAVAASVAYNKIDTATTAVIDAATVDAGGLVTVEAMSSAEITSLAQAGALGVGGGVVGVAVVGAGASSFNEVDSDVIARITDGSMVTAGNDVIVKAERTVDVLANSGAITLSVGSLVGAGVSIGGGYASNELSGDTIATVDSGSTVNTGGDLRISATSESTVNALSVGLATAFSTIGVSAAVNGAVTQNLISGTIQASVQNSTVISAGAVDLTASDISEILSSADSATFTLVILGGGGAGAVGAAVSLNDIDQDILAFVDLSVVDAGTEVSVAALSDADVDAQAFSGNVDLSVTFFIGLAGSISAVGAQNVISNTIVAEVSGGSRVAAMGHLSVMADDNAEIETQAGSLDFALAVTLLPASFAMTVGQVLASNSIENDVRATIDDAHVEVGSLSVTASADANISSFTVATGVSVGAALLASLNVSVLGATSINDVDGSVEASIKGGSTAISAGDVDVMAFDNVSLRADVGSAAAAAGIAIVPISVSTVVSIADNKLTNTAEAFIGNADVIAGGNVSVTATSGSDLDALAVATATSLLPGFSGIGTSAKSESARATTARITAAASIEAVAGDILVDAISETKAAANTKGVDIGFLAIGTTFGDATIDDVTIAALEGTRNVDANNLRVRAQATHDADTDVDVVGVSTLASFQGGRANSDVSPTVLAQIASDSAVVVTGDVEVLSDSNSTANASTDAFSFAAGIGVAAGVSLADATVDGTRSSSIGDGASIEASSITVQTISDNTAEADSTAVSGGIAAGSQGSLANATSSASISSTIGSSSNISATDDVIVETNSSGFADADASGVSVAGGIAIGASLATAEFSPDVESSIGRDSVITAGTRITVEANHAPADSASNGDGARALADASGGGIVFAGNGAESDATASAIVESFVDSGTTLTVQQNVGGNVLTGDIAIVANGENSSFARADGVTAGIVGVGLTDPTATASGTTSARLEDGVIVNNALNLTIRSVGADFAAADSDTAGGGVIFVSGGAEDKTEATAAPNVRAFVDDNAQISLAGTLTVVALSQTDAEAIAEGLTGGGVDVSRVDAVATENPTIDSSIGNNAVIFTGGSVTVTSLHNEPFTQSDGVFDAGTQVDFVNNTITMNLPHQLQGDIAITYENNGHPTLGGLAPQIANSTDGGDLFGQAPDGVVEGAKVQFRQLIFNPDGSVSFGRYIVDRDTQQIEGVVDADGLWHVDGIYPRYYAGQRAVLIAEFTNPNGDRATESLTVHVGERQRYNAIQVAVPDGSGFDPHKVQLGASFVVDTVEPSQSVDTVRDVIRFTTPHLFQTGDVVIYNVDPGATHIDGLVPGNTYFVRVIDDLTIKLAATREQATDPSTPIDIGQIDEASGTFTQSDVPLNNGDAVTYRGPVPQSFTPQNVINDALVGGVAVDANEIVIENHGFADGEIVLYTTDGSGAAIDGLQDGRQYRVIVADSNRIQLTEIGSLDPIDFQPSDGDDAPVASSHLLAQATLPIALDATQIVSANNEIVFGSAHNLSDGDLVRYSADGTAIPGLNDGQLYRVIRVDESSIQLASLADPATPLDIDASTGTNHQLQTAPAGAIGGLIPGTTYYVVAATATGFQLSATPGGPAITGLDTFVSGLHTLGVEGIDFQTTGQGRQTLSIDLTDDVATTGIHQLVGLNSIGDNTIAVSSRLGVFASTRGSSGSLLGSDKASESSAISTPTLSTRIESGARIEAMGDVNVVADSSVQVNSVARNRIGSFVAVGIADASAETNNRSTAEVQDATIVAGGNFRLTADTNTNMRLRSDAAGGGFIDVEEGVTEGLVDFETQTIVSSGAIIQAEEVLIRSQSSLGAYGDTDSEATAAIGFAKADMGIRTAGVTRTLSQVDGTITATTVDIIAEGTSLQAESRVVADAEAAAGDSTAEALVDLRHTAIVELGATSDISGYRQVAIEAGHGSVGTRARAFADTEGVGSSTAISNNDQNTTAKIVAKAGGKVTTQDLDVTADTHVNQWENLTDANVFSIDLPLGVSIDFGDETESDRIEPGDHTADREIFWEADVVIAPAPEIFVVPSGSVDTSNQFQQTVLADRIVIDGISTTGGTVDFATHVTFNNSIDTSAQTFEDEDEERRVFVEDGIIHGDQSTFTFQQTASRVRVVNESAKDLQFNDLDLITSSVQHNVTIDVDQVAKTGGERFVFDIEAGTRPTLLEIENRSDSDIIFSGDINNPIGTTTIRNAAGDITSTATGRIRTASLDAEASLGNIGTPTDRVVVEVVESNGFGHDFDALAGGDIFLDVTGILRDDSISDFTLNLNSISAGGEADLLIRDSLRETPIVGANGNVLVDVPRESGFGGPTAFHTFFRPDSDQSDPDGSSPLVVIDGENPVAIDSIVDIGLIQAGGDIALTGAPTTTTIEVVANTDLLGDGKIDAVTNGDITLTEINDTMRVSSILSTHGDVELIVPDTAGSTEDFILIPGGSLFTPNGMITVLVGDDADLSSSSRIEAGGAVVFRADEDNADVGVGSTLAIRGTITASAVEVTSREDDDTILVEDLTGGPDTPFLFKTRAGEDTITVREVGVFDTLTFESGIGDDSATFNNVTVMSPSGTGITFIAENGGDRVDFTDVTISNPAGDGIDFQAGRGFDTATFTRIEIIDAAENGILYTGGELEDTAYFSNVTVTNAGGTGIKYRGEAGRDSAFFDDIQIAATAGRGIDVAGGDGRVEIEIHNTTIVDVGSTGIHVLTGQSNDSVTIDHVDVKRTGARGINIVGGGGNDQFTVANYTVEDAVRTGLRIVAESGNNTFNLHDLEIKGITNDDPVNEFGRGVTIEAGDGDDRVELSRATISDTASTGIRFIAGLGDDSLVAESVNVSTAGRIGINMQADGGDDSADLRNIVVQDAAAEGIRFIGSEGNDRFVANEAKIFRSGTNGIGLNGGDLPNEVDTAEFIDVSLIDNTNFGANVTNLAEFSLTTSTDDGIRDVVVVDNRFVNHNRLDEAIDGRTISGQQDTIRYAEVDHMNVSTRGQLDRIGLFPSERTSYFIDAGTGIDFLHVEIAGTVPQTIFHDGFGNGFMDFLSPHQTDTWAGVEHLITFHDGLNSNGETGDSLGPDSADDAASQMRSVLLPQWADNHFDPSATFGRQVRQSDRSQTDPDAIGNQLIVTAQSDDPDADVRWNRFVFSFGEDEVQLDQDKFEQFLRSLQAGTYQLSLAIHGDSRELKLTLDPAADDYEQQIDAAIEATEQLLQEMLQTPADSETEPTQAKAVTAAAEADLASNGELRQTAVAGMALGFLADQTWRRGKKDRKSLRRYSKQATRTTC